MIFRKSLNKECVYVTRTIFCLKFLQILRFNMNMTSLATSEIKNKTNVINFVYRRSNPIFPLYKNGGMLAHTDSPLNITSDPRPVQIWTFRSYYFFLFGKRRANFKFDLVFALFSLTFQTMLLWPYVCLDSFYLSLFVVTAAKCEMKTQIKCCDDVQSTHILVLAKVKNIKSFYYSLIGKSKRDFKLGS